MRLAGRPQEDPRSHIRPRRRSWSAPDGTQDAVSVRFDPPRSAASRRTRDNSRRSFRLMTTKADLHNLVDELDEDAVGELLDYAHWLSQPEDTLTDEEQVRVDVGKAEIARGDYVTLEELRRKLAL